MPAKILFLVPYPLRQSPSQRFRFEQYFKTLAKKGYTYKVQSFLDANNWRLFYNSKKGIQKTIILVTGFAKRAAILFQLKRWDYVFIHRESTPIGPPVFEWIIFKIFNMKIVYDFDDAIWLTDRPNESSGFRLLKWRSKVQSICRWSYKISCGNEYLAGYAKQYNPSVVYNPTTIDTEEWHNPELYSIPKKKDIISIGWTGSHSTLKYLHEIENIIAELLKEFTNLRFIVISNKAPVLPLEFEFIEWNGNTEIADLLRFDIGIMPLPENSWSKGKCGFKALQYMALKIPAVVSPVGVNKKIITDGINGFLPQNTHEWHDRLRKLILDKELRKRLGIKGRMEVVENYSVLSNTPNFFSLFK